MVADSRLLLDVRRERNTVFLTLEGGETLELASGSLPPEFPEIGGSISSPLYAEIKLAAERKQVARRLFSILDRRLIPVARMKKKLSAEGFSREALEAVLEQTRQQGLYSDRLYAAAYCRDCLATRAIGRRYLEAKLRGKQVPGPIAREVAAECLDEETEAGLATKAACWKWARLGGRTDRQAEEKVARFLVGRGFSASLAWRAVRAQKPSNDEPGGDEF